MRRSFGLLNLCILIAACGGGGGGNNDDDGNGGNGNGGNSGGGGVNTLVITANNAQDISSEVLSTVNSTIEIGSTFATTQSTDSPIDNFNIEKFLRNQLRLINNQVMGKSARLNVSPNAAQTETISCTQGGSITTTINDNDIITWYLRAIL